MLTNKFIDSMKVQTWIISDQMDFTIHNSKPVKRVLSMHGNKLLHHTSMIDYVINIRSNLITSEDSYFGIGLSSEKAQYKYFDVGDEHGGSKPHEGETLLNIIF